MLLRPSQALEGGVAEMDAAGHAVTLHPPRSVDSVAKQAELGLGAA
jgi:hypothetical protein